MDAKCKDTVLTLDLTTLVLLSGPHAHRCVDGAPTVCLLEAAAWLAGEPHSDHPKAVARTIAAYGRALNDLLSSADRQQLIPFLPMLVESDGESPALVQKRLFLLADSAVRVFAPSVMDAVGLTDHATALRLTDHATALRALPPIIDKETARKGAAGATGVMCVADIAWAGAMQAAAEASGATWATEASWAADAADAAWAAWAGVERVAWAARAAAEAARAAERQEQIVREAIELLARLIDCREDVP